MNPYLDFSPVPLSYVAALRNIRPRQPGENFAYADLICADADRFICLAASNPEGRFYALMNGGINKIRGEQLAREWQVANVIFIEGTIEDLLARLEKGPSPIPPLHYLCCDERQMPLTASARAALFALAEKLLLPGGLFGYGYTAYEKDDGALRFLVREFAPEMNADQAKEFLQEIKRLGVFYFAKNPAAAAKLDAAIASGTPEQFFADYNSGDARSGAFDTIVALRPRGFSYAGDANIGSNYVERAAPQSAHQIIIDCRDNHMYEPIKDFSLNRRQRCDIWCRQPAPMTTSLPELFGAFVYGILLPQGEIPKQIKTEGKSVDLDTPLYDKLIRLMTLIPLSIGDFMAHPDGKGYTPNDIIGAIQVLIACGIARPLRGHYKNAAYSNIAQPRLVGTNQYLDKTMVTGSKLWLASPMAGSAMSVSPREALVMQALNRAGLANSVSALLPELERLANDPASGARVMDMTKPTPEMATDMIKDTVSQSIIQWYAYGLLAAA